MSPPQPIPRAPAVPAFLSAVSLTSPWRSTHPRLTRRRPARTPARFCMADPTPPSDDSLPQPAIPKTPVDPTLGTETAVISVGLADGDGAVDVETTWLQNILSSRPALPADHPLQPMRDRAVSQAQSLSIPNRRQESWRFTDLRTVYASRYTPAETHNRDDLRTFDLRRYAPDTAGIVLVFVDGVFDESLSLLTDDSAAEWRDAGGYFGSLAAYQGDLQRVRDVLSKRELGPEDGGLFPTVGTAIAPDAVVLDIPADFSVPRPVAVLFVSTGGATAERAAASATRLAVLAGSGSKISLLESHASLDPDTFSLTLSGSGFDVGSNASVFHYVVNDCGADAHLISNIHADVRAGARYEVRPVGLGGKVGRFTIGVDLEGPGAHGQVHSTVMTGGYQVGDLHSRICHNASDCTSNQLQKNIATDHGRSIFNGKIIVTEKGERTDSDQLCRSLLLSEKAAVDAMPVLEIATDDVKCTHGATVSDLQDDELFYCRSRGLSYRDAQLLLISGFALDIIGDCPFPTIREQVARKVEEIATSSRERERSNTEFTSI